MLLCDSCVIIKFLGINLFLLGHELANSLYLYFFFTDYKKLFTQAEVTFFC